MPFPNQHSGRIREPSKFIKSSYRSKQIAPGIRIIIGRLKPAGKTMVVQAVRFNSKMYSPATAKKWLNSHNYKTIRFDAANKK